MSAIEILGLEGKRGAIAHGFVAIRFATPLERAQLALVERTLVDADVLRADDDTEERPPRSSYLAGVWTPPADDAVADVREVLAALARDHGAVKAVFAQVATEIDAEAAAHAEEEDEEDEEDEEEDEEDEDRGDEESHWKAGPPPGIDKTPFPLDGYPDILAEFDWQDFGVAVKLGGEAQPGELELIQALHRFWLTPYIDSAFAQAVDEDGDPVVQPSFRHADVQWDPRHRSALLWVDRFAAPATVDEMVHHLMWVISELHEIIPIVHARFTEATMEMKYAELTGDTTQFLVLAGNPLLTHYQNEGEAAALAWEESQSTFAPAEVAAMFVELGTHCDPDVPEQNAIALRMFDHALELDPANEEARPYALLVLVKRSDFAEALGRAEQSNDNDLLLHLLGTVVENAEDKIGQFTSLVRADVLANLNGELVTPLIKAIASHAPSALDNALAAVPPREDVVAYLHNAMYGVPDQAAQLQIQLRTLELPLAAEGPHRQGYLGALNNACVIAHALKRYDLAVEIADRSAQHATENPNIHHAAACAYAAVGRYDDAFRHVKGAVETEYEYLDRVEHDTDLGPILEWPEHKALFAAWRERRAASEPVLEVTDDDFDEKVLEHERPVLVDFTASWCGPCQRLAPIIEQFAAESGGRYRVAKLDVDASEATAARFEVRSMPTLIVFHGGQERARHVGFTDKRALRALLAEGSAESH
jgi:thioredoxin 1